MKNFPVTFATLFFIILFTSCNKTEKPLTAEELKAAELKILAKIDSESIRKAEVLFGPPNCPLYEKLDILITENDDKEIKLGKIKRPIFPYDTCTAFIGYGSLKGGVQFIRLTLGKTDRVPNPTIFYLSDRCWTDFIEIEGLTKRPLVPSYYLEETQSMYPFLYIHEILKKQKVDK